MALIVQERSGAVNAANSYGSVLGMRDYFATRGVSLSTSTDDQLSSVLVLATDFMDGCYSFSGEQLRSDQGTQCPRYLLTSYSRAASQRQTGLSETYLLTTTQWQTLVSACYQLAHRALSAPLAPDPTRDASGMLLTEKMVEAGPIKTLKKFKEAKGPQELVPQYPSIDLALRNAGLLASRTSGVLVRA